MCDCAISLSFSIKRSNDSHVRCVLWTLAGLLASTVIVFGSLGSIQNLCRNEDPALLADANGFSGAVLGCKKLYRYYWFITALALVTGVYGAWVTATNHLASMRGSVLGLLVIACLLMINMTDAFNSALDISKFQEGVGRDRARTLVAGCIITAVFQAAAIFVVGMDHSGAAEPVAKPLAEAPKPKHAPVEAKAVEAPVPAPAPVAAAEPAHAAPVAAPAVAPARPTGEPAVALTVQDAA